MNLAYFYPLLRFDTLSISISVACLFFSLVIGVYSAKFLKGKINLFTYYLNFIGTALVSCLAVLANNLILLLICWGFLGLTLYMLINMSKTNEASATAKKTLVIVGGSDSIMLLGVVLASYLTGTFQMDKIQIPLNSVDRFLPILTFICLVTACFAKAGAMPMHSWIADCAQDAYIPVSAYLPAALDKLLGIYLLVRISLDLFVMSDALNIFLMIVGAFTIIAAVMMALVQHNMKRLLGYHAVSQVGYMVLGIGTGNPIGIAGGIFHMFNHTLYKSCLFLTSGNVEHRTGTVELDKLGGLAKNMPLTYTAALIASLSISGVPPFNGFFSKWMIYQGVVERFPQYKFIAVFCLTLAMFGSALTLASFMKLLHATFLGKPSEKIAQEKPKEVSWLMWLPVILLSFLCILFGIFAYNLVLKYFIFPVTGLANNFSFNAGAIPTLLIILAILFGLAIYYFNSIKKSVRREKSFSGGEEISLENKVSGTEFYNTIKEFGIFKSIYNKAQAGVFDIYEQGKTIVFGIGKFLQFLHNGVLPTYLVWTLLGMIGLFLALVR